MTLEPQNYYLGVVDFFSIILPGTLLTFVIKDLLGPLIFGDVYSSLKSLEGGAIFLFCSYLLGHFVFMIGAFVLDDYLYQPIRDSNKGRYDCKIRRLAYGKKFLCPLIDRVFACLAKRLIWGRMDHAVKRAEKIRNKYLDPLKASASINAFQWCKSRLQLENPTALANVERLEADSKFCRSLFVVFFLLFFMV